MNNKALTISIRTIIFSVVSLVLTGCSGVTPLQPGLSDLVIGKGWKGRVTATKLVKKDDVKAVEFNDPQQNVVWLDDFEFNEGTIEFDAKGKSEPPQSSFIGVAFRVVDDKTHDAVYFRTFNFRATDPERKTHAVQYVSEPKWPWYKLRENKSGQYEKGITPEPNGDDWFHVKIVLENRQVKAYVNGALEPSLIANELSDRTGGSVGLFCTGYGVISNLKITPSI